MSKFNSNFDKNTGVSYTIMRTELGNFLGIAHLQDEDKEYASTYFGCRISELKAMRDYYRTKMKRAKLEAKGMKQVRDALYTSFLTTNSEDMRKAVSITNKNYNKKLKFLLTIKNNIC